MATPNKQHDKTLNGVKPSPVEQKQRPGTDPKQPSNADYDYRPDKGETGGGAEHNPELDNESLQTTTRSGDKQKPKQ